ncbi:MAG: glycosyltransferase family 2 protein [Solirubrobacterales bacterium]|nr:glycosyltransferase family 2 protein [Solirubrobacterales bacterium]
MATDGARTAETAHLASRIGLLETRVSQLTDEVTRRLQTLQDALEFLVDDDPSGRRALAELRDDPGYATPFIATDPLVSVIIPTYDRADSLRTRSIPSVLAQSHRNLEVVVVGDHASAAVSEAVTRVQDARVSFHNLTINGPYDADSYRAWCASGTPALNAGLARARGDWIAIIGDDDTYPERHLEILLRFAQERRLEFVYGGLRQLADDGSWMTLKAFPPQLGRINLQTSLLHSGLRFLQFELAHAVFEVPNDWGIIRRMMRIGVRMGQTDETVIDYIPSRRHGFREERTSAGPLRRRDSDAQAQLVALQEECARLTGRAAAAEQAAQAAGLELERRLDDVRSSLSWRVTAPLRAAMRLIRDGQPGRR